MAQQTFTREEVINVLNVLLEQNAPSLMDAITNEHTDLDGEELLILAEETKTKPMAQQTPDPKLIESMALRYRHDFGFLDEPQKEAIRTTMKQLWEEVVGLGFYKPSVELTAQQTAVEWLINQLSKIDTRNLGNVLQIHEQAKQMEREQIIKAHDDGDVWSGEKYYTQTYGK